MATPSKLYYSDPSTKLNIFEQDTKSGGKFYYLYLELVVNTSDEISFTRKLRRITQKKHVEPKINYGEITQKKKYGEKTEIFLKNFQALVAVLIASLKCFKAN